jgi:putative MATE family efflux protein
VFGFFAIEATFRASGDTRTPMLLLVTSVALSVTLDPLLIAGVGPFPQLGVEGAAATSVMVRGGGFLIGVVIAFRRGLIRLDVPDWRAIPTMLRVGAPLSLAGVLLSVVYMWLTRFTSRFGTPALAALGVGHKVEGLGFIAISGFAISAAALVGQNIGARQEDRARQCVRLTILYCLLATVPTALAFVLIPEALVAIFTPDPGVIEDGSLYLRIIAFAQIGQTFEIVFEGALAGRAIRSGRCSRGGVHRAAYSARRLVVGPTRPLRHLARPVTHGDRPRRGEHAVLALGHVAPLNGLGPTPDDRCLP